MNTKKAQASVVIVGLVAFILLALFFVIANIPMIDKIVTLGKRIDLSISLDEKGSSIYALMASKSAMSNMETIGRFYIDRNTDIGFLKHGADELFSNLYVMTINLPSGEEKIIGTIPANAKAATSIEFWVPLPGPGSGNEKTGVFLTYE